jgi:GrpB-like predicted nucleotidyltransferase (UPF0157 family)
LRLIAGYASPPGRSAGRPGDPHQERQRRPCGIAKPTLDVRRAGLRLASIWGPGQVWPTADSVFRRAVLCGDLAPQLAGGHSKVFGMPFADEIGPAGVTVVQYRPEWQSEFLRLAERLRAILGRHALMIDHIGSTSVPDLPAKDCIDVQIRVRSVENPELEPLFSSAGFRWRPEPWNRIEVSDGHECNKLVFAPPVGERSCNVHVREDGPNARYPLLFRDYLRADPRARQGWGHFKKRLSERAPDIYDYGQIKLPATEVLMSGAERWATQTGWFVPREPLNK